MMLGDRLREAREAAGLTQKELEKKSGVSQKTISKIERGDQDASTHVVQLARACGVDPHWLATGEGEMKVEQPRASYGLAPILAWEHDGDLPPGDYVLIPGLEVQLSAGEGDEQRNLGLNLQIELIKSDALAFRSDWVRRMRLNPSKLASLRVVGDSMETRMHDGDAVVIDTSQVEVIDGKVYAIFYAGGDRVKRLYRRPGGGLTIRSDNETRYPPIVLTAIEAEHVRVIGRVVHVSGEGGL